MRVIGSLRSVLTILVCVTVFNARAQERHAKPGMGEGKFNYTSFTAPVTDKSAVVQNGNKGHEDDPEFGLLFKATPCDNCFEVIGKRTEFTKTFIDKDTLSKVYTQTSTAPMHYRDGQGRWRSINRLLTPAGNGVFSATAQEAPVTISTVNGGHVSLGKEGHSITFNNNLRLLFEDNTGIITDLGAANWNTYTAGDDGAYVTNAWPGIDIEMRTNRGAVKTNFWINHAMPAFAHGRLIVRDELQADGGLRLDTPDRHDYNGILNIVNTANEKEFTISAATAFEKNNAEHTLTNIPYSVSNGHTIDILLPGNFLNRPASSYPVIIDPLVFAPTSVSVAGSTYSPGWTTGCAILNPATVPADITITDVRFTFEYLASGGALMANGSMDFYVGACRNPWLGGWYWYCLDFTPGTCGGANISLISDLLPCIPPVSCSAYDLNVTMNFYQNYTPVAPCTNMYITATMPLTITIVGRVLDITIAPTPAAICPGTTVSLNTTTAYGSAPYTYSWIPTGAVTASTTVTPSATISYSVIVTDACGTMDTAVRNITVYPLAPIAGNTSLCLGGSSVLTNAVAGGTWSCSDTAVATITTTGDLFSVSVGSATATYTTPDGCVATAPVNVANMPDPISGMSVLCTGSSTPLTETVPGGTWSSSNAAVATVTGTGMVTALTGGTAVITYAMSPACYVTFNITSLLSSAISLVGATNPTTCISADGTITLGGLQPYNVYTVNYLFNGSPVTVTLTANASGQVIISGLDGGTVNNIIASSIGGCLSNPIPGPIVLTLPPPPAAPVLSSNGPICAGDLLSLSATCTTPGVSYNWSGPAGFASLLQNPTVAPATQANAGGYSATTIINGCESAPSYIVVVIHPIPSITNVAGTNPSVCHAADGYVTLSGLIPGVSYVVNYQYNGNPATPVSITAGATGDVIVTGLVAGTYTYFMASSFGCPSAPVGNITLIDPGAPPPPTVMSNSPVCEGKPLLLSATDSMTTVTFTWNGPAGFTSNLQYPVIFNTTMANAGTYTVVAANGICDIAGTVDVTIHPGLTLSNVTPDQSILFNSTIQLTADGARYYMWSPNDGSLSNPNIRNPIARPAGNTTYIVTGMNEWGCSDTAHVNITITYTDTVLIPTAFTPNGDGHNDVFRITNIKDSKLVEFNIYNRWGQVVYSNNWDITKGWDGNYNGMPLDMGVYHFQVIIARPGGENIMYKGDVTLIR
jgi:gliding motility-associated-like protein